MPFLVIQESGHKPRLFEVKQLRIRIGRAAENDLVLPNVSVSRSHARLVCSKTTTACLTPLTDNNPVLVNDSPIDGATTLKHGDQIRMGKFKLLWQHEDAMEMYDLHQLSELPLFHALTDGQTTHQTHALPASLQQKLIEYEILREKGGLIGENGQQIRLGTAQAKVGPDDAIPCAHRWGRRTAATIEWSGNGHELKVVGFLARVSVNDQAVTEQVLKNGDRVVFNGTPYTYGPVKDTK